MKTFDRKKFVEPSLTSVLIPKIESQFPDGSFVLTPDEKPFVTFPENHPDVGDIEIYDDGGELTVVVGNFTHSHFASYEDNLSESEKATRICDSLVDFLKELFDDRIELYGGHSRGGGFRRRNEKGRGLLSKTFFGAKSYVWSGPLGGRKE